MSRVASQHDTVLAIPAVTPRQRLADYIELAKLRITAMVVVTTYIGFAMGATTSNPLALAACLIGTALCCMGASCFNQAYERDTDALMHRTRNRPLPSGRILPLEAVMFGVGLSVLGVGLLAAMTTLTAAALAAFTIVSYAVIYTPLKRVTTLNTPIGAVPGALPPVIGYAAATGGVGPEAIAIWAIMFLWQLPHFLAIAWLYREDYARADMKMLPVVDPDGGSTFRQMLIGCMALVPVGLAPTTLGIAGRWYFLTALLCGVGFAAFAVALIMLRTRAAARAMFFASLVYLPVVLIAMMLDRV
jgi:protoheme IX farnesyltransferase